VRGNSHFLWLGCRRRLLSRPSTRSATRGIEVVEERQYELGDEYRERRSGRPGRWSLLVHASKHHTNGGAGHGACRRRRPRRRMRRLRDHGATSARGPATIEHDHGALCGGRGFNFPVQRPVARGSVLVQLGGPTRSWRGVRLANVYRDALPTSRCRRRGPTDVGSGHFQSVGSSSTDDRIGRARRPWMARPPQTPGVVLARRGINGRPPRAVFADNDQRAPPRLDRALTRQSL